MDTWTMHRAATTLAIAALLATTALTAGAAPTKRATKAATPTAVTPTAPAAKTPAAERTRSDSAAVLKGGEDGTVFRTLTVEGEDRIHVEFDRPALDITVEPEKAPGLEHGSAKDVLERTVSDPATPMLALSSREESRYLAHPWLTGLTSGAVARFRPAVTDVERWKLTIANSKGEPVASFAGRGEPPKEIAWDGRSAGGGTAVPGLTYSHVFEAWDRAGNRRSFVGPGFEVASYRIDSPEGPTFVIAGTGLTPTGTGTPTVVREVASRLNQMPKPARRIQVTATARSAEYAANLAARVARDLAPLVIGDPARVQPLTRVEPDAPVSGTVKVAAMP